MKHNSDYITEDEARAIIEKHKANMAKRGIRYDGSASGAEIDRDGVVFLLAPQTELSYRRLIKEMKENADDE
jgi:hypothetical protein